MSAGPGSRAWMARAERVFCEVGFISLAHQPSHFERLGAAVAAAYPDIAVEVAL